jgi:hypothetical protein
MRNFFLFIALIAVFIGGCKKQAKENDEDIRNSTIGIKDKLKNVIGGNQIAIDDAPYQIAVFRNGVFSAGGVIIGENWILTAAHVVTNSSNQQIPANELTIRVGSSNINNGVNLNVDQVIRHPNYTLASINNDIALIHLSTPLTYSSNIQSINYVNNATSVLINNLAKVSGWGLISFNSNTGNGTNTVDLFATDVKISSIEASILYTSSTSSSQQSPCFGDSGGPLTTVSIYGDRLLVGIVNGWGDCNIGSKGYARVSSYSDWIFAETGISGVNGVPAISSSISGPAAISRGVEYNYSGNNIPSGATLTWTVPSNIGVITSGQGTRLITIETITAGTQIVNSNIKLKIVDSYGNSKTISQDVTLKSGR